jgi:hypothetical protein
VIALSTKQRETQRDFADKTIAGDDYDDDGHDERLRVSVTRLTII